MGRGEFLAKHGERNELLPLREGTEGRGVRYRGWRG